MNKKRRPPMPHRLELAIADIDAVKDWLETIDTDPRYMTYEAFFMQNIFLFARASHAVEFKMRFG